MEICGFENYLIYDDGRVFSKKRGIFLKVSKNNRGYYYVQLSNKIQKLYRVNRLVALYYIPNPENLPQVDHIDGNKLNNRVENLRWCSSSDNLKNTGPRKQNTSGFKNICWNKEKNKWGVRLYYIGKSYSRGNHIKIEDALIARNKLVRDLGIEFYKFD